MIESTDQDVAEALRQEGIEEDGLVQATVFVRDRPNFTSNEATLRHARAIAQVRLLREKLEPPKVWDSDVLDAMVRAFEVNENKHGMRETLMAVVNTYLASVQQ